MNFLRNLFSHHERDSLDPVRIAQSLQPIEAQINEIRQLSMAYAQSMLAMASAGAALANGIAKYYGKHPSREKLVGQFRHTQKCLDSMVQKIFKEEFQSEVLQPLERWKAQADYLKLRSRDYDLARQQVEQMRQEFLQIQQAREAKIKKGLRPTAADDQNFARADARLKKYSSALETMRKALVGFQADVMNEGRFKAVDPTLFRLMELQAELFSSVASLTDSYQPAVAQFRRQQRDANITGQEDASEREAKAVFGDVADEDELEAEKQKAHRLKHETMMLTREDENLVNEALDSNFERMKDEISRFLSEEWTELERDRGDSFSARSRAASATGLDPYYIATRPRATSSAATLPPVPPFPAAASSSSVPASSSSSSASTAEAGKQQQQQQQEGSSTGGQKKQESPASKPASDGSEPAS